MPPSYKQNKEHIFKWRENNRDTYLENKARNNYKLKAKRISPEWAEAKYEFLAILRD